MMWCFNIVFMLCLLPFAEFLPHSLALSDVTARGEQRKLTVNHEETCGFLWVWTLLETFGRTRVHNSIWDTLTQNSYIFYFKDNKLTWFQNCFDVMLSWQQNKYSMITQTRVLTALCIEITENIIYVEILKQTVLLTGKRKHHYVVLCSQVVYCCCFYADDPSIKEASFKLLTEEQQINWIHVRFLSLIYRPSSPVWRRRARIELKVKIRCVDL